MQKMQVAATESAPSDLQDDISRLEEFRLGSIDDLHLILALPHESFHSLACVASGLVVGHILLRDGAVIVSNDLLGLEGCLRDRHIRKIDSHLGTEVEWYVV